MLLALLHGKKQLEPSECNDPVHLQEVDVAIVADVGTLQRLPTIVRQGS